MKETAFKVYIVKSHNDYDDPQELEINCDTLQFEQILTTIKCAFMKANEAMPDYVIFNTEVPYRLRVFIKPLEHTARMASEWWVRKLIIKEELEAASQCNNPNDEPEDAPVKFYFI